MLVVFSAVSVWVLALDLFQVIAHDRVWTGGDGVYIVDQLQYMAWVRSASQHLLVANLFVLRPTPADYFQPAVAVSGGLTALGVAPWLAMLVWKPVAVGACFYAVRQFVARTVAGRWARRAALVLALFFGSFTVLGGSATVIGDLWTGFDTWGYVFGVLALAAAIAAMLSYERGRTGLAAGVLGALASALHPWNGEILILIVIGSELMLRRRRVRRAAVTIGLTALPLVYYEVLGHADLSWRLAREASRHTFPLMPIVLALVPLLVPALLSCRGRPQSFLVAAARCWPLAAIVVYVVSSTGLSATPQHAFQGLALPLAVLAVNGLRDARFVSNRRRFLLGTAAVTLLTVPALAYELVNARDLVAPRVGDANFITHGEQRALSYLRRDPQPGGVISRSYLGALVPGVSGRHTYVGDCLWSEPGCSTRLVTVRKLFSGELAPAAARRFVAGSGARFLLADCRTRISLTRLLGSQISAVRRFGCASVYELG